MLPTALTESHLRGLRGLRAAMGSAHGRLDHGAPAMETRDFEIPTPAGPLPARLYQPDAATTPGPVLLFFHGGGFVICDLETHDPMCRRLAAAAGMRLIAVDYRLAPEARFPAQIDDGEAAARWTIASAADLGIDPARVLLAGDSAGGYIAVAASARLNAERPGAIAAQVLIYPLLELGDAAWASSVFADARVVGRVALGYIRAQLGIDEQSVPSLVDADPALTPPTLIAMGGPLDPCRPDGRRMAARLKAAARIIAVLEYPRLPHGFGNLTPVSPAARRAMAEIGRGAAGLVAP